jgi:glycosyltransferase involved in cell wall biosynthesis
MLLPATVHHHNKDRFTFHCIYFLPWKDQMVAALEQEGVQVTCMKASTNLQMLFRIKAIVTYCREHQIDLIHAHLPWAGVVAGYVGKLCGIPVVYTEHNNVNRYHWATQWLNKQSYFRFAKVIAVSEDARLAAAAQFKQLPCTMQTIHNGVDTDFFECDAGLKIESKTKLGFTDETLVVSNVAVFRTQKRLDRWLQIVQRIHAQEASILFLLIGDGPLRGEVEQLIADYALQDVVHLPGLQQEMKPWFVATDVFLMSSDWEGLPIALLEAMSMGCVPVVTDAGGIPEVVDDRCGIVYAKEDIDRAVAAILSLVQDRRSLQAYRVNARKRIEEGFSLKRMVRQLEDVYGEVVGR